jgi:xanthine dehydrogenase accessory factor
MSQQSERHLLHLLLTAQEAGEPAALATVIRARGSVPRRAGSKMVVYGDGRTQGTIGGGEMESLVIREAQAALGDGRTRLIPYSLVDPSRGDPGVCGGELEIFVEPYPSPPTVLVIGCGHVGQAVAHLAHWLGYRVVVSDDRPELAREEVIPNANLYLPGPLAEGLTQFNITGQTYVAAVTRNVLVDREILPLLLDTPAPYIGVIGSRRRWAETRRLLLTDGLTEEQLARFHSPIGLEIQAETPAEIAVSIMAEIISRQRGGGVDAALPRLG